ncbi:MAG: hypothetical protein Kow00107_06210 [Planctomycetota bacterium]
MTNLLKLSIVLLLLLSASCERRTYVVSRVFCLNTGAEATVRLRLTKDSPITAYTLELVSDCIDGRIPEIDDDLRKFVITYIIEVTEKVRVGGPGVNVLNVIGPQSDTRLWCPVRGFLKCRRTGAVTAKGLNFTLIPGSDLGPYEWESVSYDQFIREVRAWLDSLR